MIEIRIELDNSDAIILDKLPKEVEDSISYECSFMEQGARFTKAFQQRKWDGRKKLYSYYTKMFPVGLYSIVKSILERYGYEVKPISKRIKPEKVFDIEFKFPYPFRDYQNIAVERAIKAQRGILDISTGGGKTVVAFKIFQELGVKALFIVNTKEALYDTIKCAKQAFPDFANLPNEEFYEYFGVWSGETKIMGKYITISTAAAVYSSIKRDSTIFKKEAFNLLFDDECHKQASESWYKVTRIIDAFYKIGLTGTPYRSDKKDLLLQAATGRIIYSVKTKELQDKRMLVKSKVFFIELPYVKLNEYIFSDIYLVGIVLNAIRNQFIVSLIKKHAGKSILVIVEKIEHGEILLNMIKAVEPTVVFANSKSKNRVDIKNAFESGKQKVLIATKIYNESADIPRLNIVVNASAGKSSNAIAQKFGRMLRLHDSKEESIFYDFMDRTDPLLEEHSKVRMRVLKKAGQEIKIIKDID